MTKQPKFCKDCALYGGDNVCLRASVPATNPVTGELVTSRFASLERVFSSASTDSCGPEGLFWTAKP